jgi:hypothetical protein
MSVICNKFSCAGSGTYEVIFIQIKIPLFPEGPGFKTLNTSMGVIAIVWDMESNRGSHLNTNKTKAGI